MSVKRLHKTQLYTAMIHLATNFLFPLIKSSMNVRIFIHSRVWGSAAIHRTPIQGTHATSGQAGAMLRGLYDRSQ